jgi:hypothetical protein
MKGIDMKHGAYLLINADTGKERDIQRVISSKPYVQQCNVVSGLHDLICYIESDTVNGLKDAVFGVREVPGISKTVTCISFNSTG